MTRNHPGNFQTDTVGFQFATDVLMGFHYYGTAIMGFHFGRFDITILFAPA